MQHQIELGRIATPLKLLINTLWIWVLWTCGVILAVQLLAANAHASDSDAIAADLSLVGVVEDEGVSYANLVDRQSGHHYLASSRRPDSGLELIALTAAQDAIIRHNGQIYFFRLGENAGNLWQACRAGSPANPQPSGTKAGETDPATPTPPPSGKLPLVFQVSQSLNLTEEQQATVGRLRQQFQAALAEASSNPIAASENTSAAQLNTSAGSSTSTSLPKKNDTRTLSVWNSAQEQSDEQFRMLFGTEAFNLSQMGPPSSP